WYAKAARQDVPEAQLRLAHLTADSPQTCGSALFWYKKAAAHGVSQAMYELGRLYLTKSCGANRVQAFLWLHLAGRYGLPEGRLEADALAAGLSADERKSAERSADKWIRKHSGPESEEEMEPEP